jgi:hypothetical protein
MKKINLAILFFVFSTLMLLAYYGCKKDNDNKEQIYGDSQTEELNLIVDSCSVLTPSLDSILDVYGIPYGNSKSTLIDGTIEKLVGDLIAFTHAKCEEKLRTFHNESSPKHFGFAYSYGQRNMLSRLSPPAGNSLHNREAVWGTDCSGLLVNAFIYAGIPIDNCNSVALPANLSFALAKSDDYKDIIVEDKGQLSIWQIKTGDIVLWPNVPHIGIVGRNLAGDVIIFQSNGTGFPADEASQTKNWLSETRGVHPFSMIKMLTMKDGWPSPYKVYRFKEKDPSPSGFTITTKSVSDITNNSALSGGDITFSSQVAPTITLRGVCWSLTSNPTVSDYKTNDGSGTGSFSSAITGLSPSTTYYVRAFAESGGTIYYGNQLSFQTTGGGSGNISKLNLSIGGVSYYYESNSVIGWHGYWSSVGYNYYIGYSIDTTGFYIDLNSPLAVGTYNFNQPCYIGDFQSNFGVISIIYENFYGGTSHWTTHCPQPGNPNTYLTSYNGTLTITQITFEMISGQINAQLDFGGDINLNIKDVSGEFTFYRSN